MCVRYEKSYIEEVLAKTDLRSVVNHFCPDIPRQGNACCPFDDHEDSTPSFMVNDKKQTFTCFGSCQRNGNAINFLREKEGMSFPEAVKWLAEKAGIQPPAEDREARARFDREKVLFAACEAAAVWFVDQLHSSAGNEARAYLVDRQIKQDTMMSFRIGYAPNGYEDLKNHLLSKGFKLNDLVAAGLVFKTKRKTHISAFRGRIMFPITNSTGRVIAFGGRDITGKAPAKYLNSPETDIFKKSETLFNLSTVRSNRGEKDAAVVMEGYLDVIQASQSGIKNVVAPLGTALTETQIENLFKYVSRVVICFDGDEGGEKGKVRAASNAMASIAPGKNVLFASLPEGKDPDELLKSRGRGPLLEVLKEAQSLSSFLFDMAAIPVSTPEDGAQIEATLADYLNRIQDETLKQHYQMFVRSKISALYAQM